MRATQASPPCTPLPPPLRGRRGFQGDVTPCLPVKALPPPLRYCPFSEGGMARAAYLEGFLQVVQRLLMADLCPIFVL